MAASMLDALLYSPYHRRVGLAFVLGNLISLLIAPKALGIREVHENEPVYLRLDEFPGNSKITVKLADELTRRRYENLRVVYQASDTELMLQCITAYEDEDLLSLISIPGDA